MIPFCHFTSKIINFERKNNGHASSIDNFPSKQPSADNFAIASAKDSQNLRSLRADLAQPTNPIPDPSVKLRSSGLNLGFSLYRGITLKPPDPSPLHERWITRLVKAARRRHAQQHGERRVSFPKLVETSRGELTFDCRFLIYDETFPSGSGLPEDFIMHYVEGTRNFTSQTLVNLEWNIRWVLRRLNFIFP